MRNLFEAFREIRRNRNVIQVNINKQIYLQRLNSSNKVEDLCFLSDAKLDVVREPKKNKPGVAVINKTEVSNFQNITECRSGDVVRFLSEDLIPRSDAEGINLSNYQVMPEVIWEKVFSKN